MVWLLSLFFSSRPQMETLWFSFPQELQIKREAKCERILRCEWLVFFLHFMSSQLSYKTMYEVFFYFLKHSNNCWLTFIIKSCTFSACKCSLAKLLIFVVVFFVVVLLGRSRTDWLTSDVQHVSVLVTGERKLCQVCVQLRTESPCFLSLVSLQRTPVSILKAFSRISYCWCNISCCCFTLKVSHQQTSQRL